MSWALAVAALVALVLIHELGHFVAAKAVGLRVERFSIFFGPAIARTTRGETEYRLGVIPFGGYVKVTGQNAREELSPEEAAYAYFTFAPWRRALFVLAGPAANVLAAFLIAFGAILIGGAPALTPTVAPHPVRPAASVLEGGDRVIAVDGRRGSVPELAKQIRTHTCDRPVAEGCLARVPAIVTVRRNGKIKRFAIRPVYHAAAGYTQIGIRFQVVQRHEGVAHSLTQSSRLLIDTFVSNVKGIGQILSGKTRQVSSIVGVVEVTQSTTAYGAVATLILTAVISLSLAIMNLLPILPLDGGHLVWLAAEKIRGRAVPVAVVERFALIGVMLILGVSLLALTHDVSHLR